MIRIRSYLILRKMVGYEKEKVKMDNEKKEVIIENDSPLLGLIIFTVYGLCLGFILGFFAARHLF